jgi:regulatory protein
MKITSIKQQERLKGRYSVYVDEKYSFSLSADGLLDSHLYNGQELDEQQLESYKKLSADDKAYGLTLAYVARRLRSSWEMQQYFRRKDYDEALGQQLLDRLTHLGLVDDQKFAEAWVNTRRLLKSVSKRRLVQELRAKRINADIIERTLTEDITTDESVITELISRKRRQTRYQDDVKLMQYLARQGFGYDDIKRAFGAVAEADEE